LKKTDCAKDSGILEENRLAEVSGIIISTRFRIEKALNERQAFDEHTATDAGEANVNFMPVLDLMERGGLIGRTSEGKIFMTKKGQQKQIRVFR
jgi:hypothetical protein